MRFFNKKPMPSLPFIGFLQALGLSIYCGLVGIIFWRGEMWFGRVHSYLGPVLIITLFATSALISALITLGYPFILFYKEDKPKEALSLVAYTAGWLLLIILLIMAVLIP